MPRRFVLLTLDYPPMSGGVARYLFGLVQAAQGGIEVMTPDTVKPAAFFFAHGWFKWWPLVGLIRSRRGQCDGLIVSHVLPVGTAAWLARKFGGSRYFIILHGLDLRLAQTTLVKRWLLRRILRGAGGVVCNSRFTADELVRFDALIEPLVITPALNPSSNKKKPMDRLEIRRRFFIPPDAYVMISVCRLVKRKGIDLALQAMTQLPSNVFYVIVGDGPERESLFALAARMAERVRFFSALPDDDRDALYQASDVFVLPVREQGADVEGFGLVFLEAARAGLPVIAGRNGGVPEAVRDGVTARLIDSSNPSELVQAVERLKQEPELARRMGEAGRAWSERFSSWAERWQRLHEFCVPQTAAGRDLISVIIPAYNHADEMLMCLRSLERQTERPLEVIVVDDGSETPVAAALSGLKFTFPLKIMRSDSNRGAAAARNLGAREARGDFVIFLDADAVLVPTALQDLHRALSLHPDAAFAYASFYFGWKLFRGQAFDPAALRRANYIPTAALIRRGDVLAFDETLKKFQDWDMWLRFAEQGKRGTWVAHPLFRFRPRRAGMSHWLPRFMHRLPWHKLGWMPAEIKAYREAELILRKKHPA